MKNHLPEFVKKRSKVSLDELSEVEHRVVQHLGERWFSVIVDPVNERAPIRRRQLSCNQQPRWMRMHSHH